ncbi:cupin fold metalloprotein, WbuC family [Escherichia coli]|nr:WbuC family cupin fold metalloprotein [Escherichia coli]EAA4789805.1 cupin fold metalloprotein, WbuC family [Escherichia coli]EEQ2896126.1 cupin fold metalloprotein, WbuC family [Escherichia coli]EEQ3196598.1 cupin fold metalloprotein, WbuC family [Escherichia coli]EEQ3751523.1 cupin fold metalloprotein, WbuC family [Escherichia coli]EEQ4233583.1 cupin fold metalloprotein, WbuC family [Escherichia coli]
MKKIDSEIIDKLFNQAKDSDRKRAHYLLHQSYEEKVQRLLIAFLKNSYVEPHFHKNSNQWEMFIVIQGVFELTKYSEGGSIIERIIIEAGADILAVEIYPCEIHSVRCLSEKGLLMEVKEGPFNPLEAKEYLVN